MAHTPFGKWHNSQRFIRFISANSPTVVLRSTSQHNRPDFDWQLALALAGCSFEAYNGIEEPTDNIIKQIGISQTEITYVDTSFVRRKLDGLLEVTVEKAANLKPSDWWPGSKSDPYCQVSINGNASRTSTIKSDLNPVWNQKLYLFVQNKAQQRLSVRVFDEDISDSDDLLGAGIRGLADLGDEQEHRAEIKLVPGDATVTLTLCFEPFKDDEALIGASSGRMGGPVLGSPANTLLSSPWRDIKALLIPAEKAADAAFDPVAYIDCPLSDTQAWLWWNPSSKTAVIAFRGTEQTKWKDILTDVSLVPASMGPEGVYDLQKTDISAVASKGLEAFWGALTQAGTDVGTAAKRGVLSALQSEEQEPEWVHAGFYKAYRSVRGDIFKLVDTLLAGEKEQWTLLVTGHSLGGALSTLCAYDLARRQRWADGIAPKIVNYSYGSPRVGNRVFAEKFNRLVPDCWRVVNNNDAVTLVPRLMGFAHVGGRVQLTPEGTVAIEKDSFQDVGEGASMANFAAAVVTSTLTAEGVLDEGKGRIDDAFPQGPVDDLKGGVSAVIEAEVKAMNTLLDGSAVEEHLEPLYLENFVAAVKHYFKSEQMEC